MIFLSAGALVLAPGEAQAEERSAVAVQQPTPVTGEGVASALVQTPPVDRPAVEIPLPKSPPADPPPEPGPTAQQQLVTQRSAGSVTDRVSVQSGVVNSPPKGASTPERPSTLLVGSVSSRQKPDPPPGPVVSGLPTPEQDPSPQRFALVIINGEVVSSDPASPWSTTGSGPSPDAAAYEQPARVPTTAWDTWRSDQYDPATTSEPQSFMPAVEPVTPEPPGSLPAAFDKEASPLWSVSAQPAPLEENAFSNAATADMATVGATPVAGQKPWATGPIPSSAPATVGPAQIVPPPAPVVGSKPPAASPSIPPPRLSSSLGATMSKAASGTVDALRSVAASAASIASAAEQALGSLMDRSAAHHPINEPHEDPSQSTPQPVAPVAPPLGGSFFSMFGGGSGGQTGLGAGGAAPLLLAGALASTILILLRKDGRLTLISNDVPKLTSALLSPLERPG